MTRGSQKIILWILVGLLVLLLLGRLLRRGKGPVRLAAGNCVASLWDHVYHPQRLQVIETCTAVEGRVESVRKEGDGDIHIRLEVENGSLLNMVNFLHAHGDLIVEPICEVTPTQADAVSACAGFTPRIAIPRVGERVRVTGSFVTDREHGWNEIHPVTKIEVLP